MIPAVFCWLLGTVALLGNLVTLVLEWTRTNTGLTDAAAFVAYVPMFIANLTWIAAGGLFWGRRWFLACMGVVAAIVLEIIAMVISGRI